MPKKAIVIGAGFSGLSSAAYLAAAGFSVEVFEKNESAGGRARQFSTPEGYLFDMGPSWYWMPDVFEKFFMDFGHSASDFYKLDLLDPAFNIIFGMNDCMSIPANFSRLLDLFESIEPGSSDKLKVFLQEAEYKYVAGVENLVYKPAHSFTEFTDLKTIGGIARMQVFSSFSKHVRKYFKHPKLIALMEFPVLFLGAMPQETPALYSLMNYAGLKLGTWYPQGGFWEVADAMYKVALNHGAKFHFNSPVKRLITEGTIVTHVETDEGPIEADVFIGSADYQHIEEKLLPKERRGYSENYWNKKTFAPSSLIFYLGVNKKLDKLNHHNLFFDADLGVHSTEIYKDKKWPAEPLFYVCCTSRSDKKVAPEGHENLFLLMPIAPGIEDTTEQREKYFEVMMTRICSYIGEDFRSAIDFKRSYCINDFISDYNSYKGNAYGLANTLRQTAFLKPKMKSKKLDNLYFAGQLTVPGPGVPPAIISGKVAAMEVIKKFSKSKHEVLV